ncbi:hypothetical protein QP027_11875 [Corynebacterium breve]|uniref:Uncharacterized protein n=1 Tax=Corynebacterium breve TaxID=3049799 RepID=A0ABY8VDL7_9CORY|nr:hypothetical protein [Corynebacterium breve]WIM67755.1 hypothetical protein QP027_11875 [Corynebacterium breve]
MTRSPEFTKTAQSARRRGGAIGINRREATLWMVYLACLTGVLVINLASTYSEWGGIINFTTVGLFIFISYRLTQAIYVTAKARPHGFQRLVLGIFFWIVVVGTVFSVIWHTNLGPEDIPWPWIVPATLTVFIPPVVATLIFFKRAPK